MRDAPKTIIHGRSLLTKYTKNNAMWLYHTNFMLIIGLQLIFPENFIDFLDADAYSALR